MKKICDLILFITVIGPATGLAAPRMLSEKELVAWSKERAPKLDEIKATLLSAENQKNILDEKYAPELYGRAAYSETQEKPVIEFLPVFSPVKTAQLGVRKRFDKGLRAALQASTDQRSASSPTSGTYNNVTTTILSLTLQMDLWQDLFGRVTEAERQNSLLESKRANLESEITTRAFEITLRRIYWSLVATEEQLKIAKRLQVTASEQVADAEKRLRSSIGDEGEVARYVAQKASRQGQVILLTYQRENLLKQLKTMLPQLGPDEISLAPYDLEQTQRAVIDCSTVITKEAAVPYDFTKYDEMVTLLKEIKSNQRTINQRYSDVDVNLFGTVKSTGVGSDKLSDVAYRGSYGDAFNDQRNNNRSGYEVGVNVIVPLGETKKTTQKTRTLYDEKRLLAQIDGTDAQISSTHTQLAKSMGLIQEVIATQRLGTMSLDKRLQSVRKKYSQARVSVNDLILDQDALLNSELSTIDSQLQSMNVLFDYFMIFTDTPCSFNRI